MPTDTKFFISTGNNADGYVRPSEMIDLTVKGESKCPDWPECPNDIFAAVGGLLGTKIMICGGAVYDQGWHYSDECYIMGEGKATLTLQMSIKRAFGKSLVLNHNKMWITGGYSPNDNGISGRTASSEFVTIKQSFLGPDLPLPLMQHEIIAFNDTCSLLIGGDSTGISIASTYFYNHEDKIWSDGPCCWNHH